MNEITTVEPDIQSIARFQSLQAGHYWKACEAIIEEGIDKDEVLLIKSIRWVDDAPHTIVLEPHPLKLGKTVYLQVPTEDGGKRKKYFQYDDHKFLLQDFLELFAFEPDHERIRAEELRQVQGRVAILQQELVDGQTNPDAMSRIIESGLLSLSNPSDEEDRFDDELVEDAANPNDQASVTSAISEPSSELTSVATGTLTNALSVGITPKVIDDLKVAANREYQIATIKSKWIQEKTTEIGNAIAAMTPFFSEKGVAALASIEDKRAYVAKVVKGIESLDLYVGKDVHVHTIREGESAPRDVPLTFVQRKLFMDEEVSVWADVDQMFDATKFEVFSDALRSHDDFVNQIFPTERCVLVMAANRYEKNYNDSLKNVIANIENRKVFMLVRNGMNIHRVDSPIESHMGTARLFPSKDDQDAVFKGFDGSTVKFEDIAYSDHLAKHENFALHYKRFLLMACGLDHNHNLFGEFYDGPKSFNFVSLSFQDKYCRFLHDDDGSFMLEGIKRPTVHEWIKEKNSYLRAGSRVMCKWGDLMNPDTAPGACKAYDRGDGFDTRFKPKNKVDVVIAYRDGENLCVDIEVFNATRSAHKERTFNCKVNLSAVKNSNWDSDDLPFLCMDAVQPEDVHYYIHNRGSRKNHLAYIRFFKLALNFTNQEHAEEQDTRARMLEALSIGNIASGPDAATIVNKAVMAWRAANRGKSLPRFIGSSAPADWTSLLDQMFMLAGEGARRIDEVEAFVRELGYEPLRLVLTGGAKLAVYATPATHERDDRLEPHLWAHYITIAKGKTKYSVKAKRWSTVPKSAASETTIHEWPGIVDWAGKTSAFGSYENKQGMFDATNGFAEVLQPFTKKMAHDAWNSMFMQWKRARLDTKGGEPHMYIPVGVLFYEKTKRVSYLCIGSSSVHALLYHLAQDAASQKEVFDYFVSWYKAPYGQKYFVSAISDSHPWKLRSLRSIPKTLIFGSKEGLNDASTHDVDPLLLTRFEKWLAAKDSARAWINDAATDPATGKLGLDAILDIKRPDEFDPVRVQYIKLSGPFVDGVQVPVTHYPEWHDIIPRNIEMGESGEVSNASLARTGRAAAESLGYNMSDMMSTSITAAREFLARTTSLNGSSRIAEASTLPDAPQPPKGIERWYILPK